VVLRPDFRGQQPNTHVLYLIHQKLSLEENIYEILFQAQNPGLFD
jgi:hypothetical protein